MNSLDRIDFPIGVNLDGVLDHDGLPDPTPGQRFARVAASGVFDYLEKNLVVGEDVAPYVDLVAEHGVPIGIFGGIFCAGRDEGRARDGAAWAARFGARVYNCQLFRRHADGHDLTDDNVADFYLRLLDWTAGCGTVPSLEVHVDMWNEDPRRVECRTRTATTPCGSPGCARAGSCTAMRAASRRDGRPGRAIQYPFLEPAPDTFHSPWDAAKLEPWKRATRDQLAWAAAQPAAVRCMRQFSCEFIPFADCGGGSRYSIWDQNVACAAWLRAQWAGLTSAPAVFHS